MPQARTTAIAVGPVMLAAQAGFYTVASQEGDGVTANVAAPAESRLELTPVRRDAIFRAVGGDKSKRAPARFSPAVGVEVPPMIELYALPDDVTAANPAAKLYQYTIVQDQVVIVDPTRMRVVEVIGESSR
jgi:Protein of unknown function (DUF1236)